MQRCCLSFLIAFAFTVPILSISMFMASSHTLAQEVLPGMSSKVLLLFLLTTPVEFGVGYGYHKKAIKALLACGQIAIGMDFMISIGTLAAYLYSFVAMMIGLSGGTGCSDEVGTAYFETSAVLIMVMR